MGGSHRNMEFRSIIRCFLFFDTLHDVQKLFRGALQEWFSNPTAHMAVFCRLDSLTEALMASPFEPRRLSVLNDI